LKRTYTTSTALHFQLEPVNALTFREEWPDKERIGSLP
jgi:hypothetical protein